MKETYWKKLTQCKFELCYLEAHLSRCVKANGEVTVFCAIASSAAISAWAAWQKLSFIWGLIIAISQVVLVINDVLPYKKRIKDLSNITTELTAIYNDMEKDWYFVSNGLLSDDKINELCYAYKKKWDQVDEKYFKKDSLPQIKKCIEIAEKEKDNYFQTNL